MTDMSKEKDDKIKLTLPLNRRLLKYIFIVLLLIFSLYAIVTKPQLITSAISFVLGVLSPILIGLCFAYVVNLILRPLERFWLWIWRKKKKQHIIEKIKRPICLTLSILILLGAVFAIVFMIVPAINDTVVSFVDKLPEHAKTVENWYNNLVDFLGKYNFDIPEISFDAAKITKMAQGFITEYGNNVLNTTVDVTASIVSAVVDVVLGIVFSIYLLSQKEKIGQQATKTVRALLKPKKSERLIKLVSYSNGVFSKFITGQLAEACIIGVLCFIGMIILGIPNAVIISVLVGFTALIPVFGALIGTGIGAFLILLEEPIKALWFIVFIIVLQQLEGNLIYPKVVGKSVGLPGIWVLTAVTIGGALFGVFGMLFSVPLCSIVYVLFRNFVNNRTAKQEDEKTQETGEPDIKE